MPRSSQASFFTHPAFRHYARREHGGAIGKGLRKRERPLDPGRPLHVVLRAERARGEWSMLKPRHERRIKHLVETAAERHGVKIHRFANSGNHLHIVLQARKRESYQNFLRAFSGLVARTVTGAKKGSPVGKFWSALAYSRVVQWGRDLRGLDFYVILNELEGLGIWSRRWTNSGLRVAPS